MSDWPRKGLPVAARFAGRGSPSTDADSTDPRIFFGEQLSQCFLHELLHYIFYVMGEHELRNNEKLVDLIAHFLHQVEDTSNYEA